MFSLKHTNQDTVFISHRENVHVLPEQNIFYTNFGKLIYKINTNISII